MSGAVDTGSYGLLSALIADSQQTRAELNKLTTQVSDGLVAPTYDGLGAAASVPLSLAPQVADLTTWQNNIASASAVQQATQTAMTALQQIASNFYSQVQNLNNLNAAEIDSLAGSAQDALKQVASLLDTQVGGVYVFGGADSANPPLPQPDNILASGFYTQIAAAVGNLGAAGGPATAAATLAIAASNAAGTSPFSSYMSQPAATLLAQAPVVQTGPNTMQPVGLLASANSAAVSTGASTTGSYMRDLMRALATIGALSSAQANLPGFSSLVQDTATSLQGAIGAMADEAGILGNRQTALSQQQTTMSDTQTALKSQISNVEDVDVAQVMSQITLVQTQLQASYQLIGGLSGLTLAKLLPVA
ncbi:MAG TPA: flagellin [Acetobacteraceae bacterium]|nr:flagellin [Acetobacteraceae bacterium]